MFSIVRDYAFLNADDLFRLKVCQASSIDGLGKRAVFGKPFSHFKFVLGKMSITMELDLLHDIAVDTMELCTSPAVSQYLWQQGRGAYLLIRRIGRKARVM